MTRQKEIIILLVSMFVVTVAWIAFDLYHNAVTSTISEPLQQDIIPIDPNFDTQVIISLKQRQYSDPQYTLSSQQQITATQSGTGQKTIAVPAINALLASPSSQPTIAVQAIP